MYKYTQNIYFYIYIYISLLISSCQDRLPSSRQRLQVAYMILVPLNFVVSQSKYIFIKIFMILGLNLGQDLFISIIFMRLVYYMENLLLLIYLKHKYLFTHRSCVVSLPGIFTN